MKRSASSHRLFIILVVLLMALPLAAREKQYRVRFETTAGNITVRLFNDTPLHRDNFLRLVREGYFDGLLFHRVIKDFMIQSGDPDSRTAVAGQMLGEGGPSYTIPLEARIPRHYHRCGALAAAREGDDVNPERRSHASQFYIVCGRKQTDKSLADIEARVSEATNGQVVFTDKMRKSYKKHGGAPHLDGQYTVFGEVTKGMRVVRAIQAVATDRNDRPLTDVRILHAVVVD